MSSKGQRGLQSPEDSTDESVSSQSNLVSTTAEVHAESDKTPKSQAGSSKTDSRTIREPSPAKSAPVPATRQSQFARSKAASKSLSVDSHSGASKTSNNFSDLPLDQDPGIDPDSTDRSLTPSSDFKRKLDPVVSSTDMSSSVHSEVATAAACLNRPAGGYQKKLPDDQISEQELSPVDGGEPSEPSGESLSNPISPDPITLDPIPVSQTSDNLVGNSEASNVNDEDFKKTLRYIFFLIGFIVFCIVVGLILAIILGDSSKGTSANETVRNLTNITPFFNSSENSTEL